MTIYSPGDIILVRFPFTDLSSTKKRTAVVVSPANYSTAHGDVVALALTSQRQANSGLRLQNWKQAGLLKRSWCKPVIGTLASSVILRRLGKLNRVDYSSVKVAVQRLLDTAFIP